jgi:4-hydroxy-4-methyl-2-oxoglutarate aldolase
MTTPGPPGEQHRPGRPAEPAPDAVLQQLRLPTAVLSDALDRLGLAGSVHGLAPLQPGQRLAGRAFTVRYVPAGADRRTVGDFIDSAGAGQVIAIDNQGRNDCTVWGGILTSVARHRGVAGTVIWGVCRDVAAAQALAYPIYSCGRFMRTGKDRVEVAEVGGVIAVGDAQVRQDDVIVGDDDGVVVVPQQRAREVAEVAVSIAEAESLIRREALAGRSLAAARRGHGYHELQRRR